MIEATRENVERYRDARYRLGLPNYRQATVREFEEGALCTGCKAFYQFGCRVVHVRAGCPVHQGTGEAAA